MHRSRAVSVSVPEVCGQARKCSKAFFLAKSWCTESGDDAGPKQAPPDPGTTLMACVAPAASCGPGQHPQFCPSEQQRVNTVAVVDPVSTFELWRQCAWLQQPAAPRSWEPVAVQAEETKAGSRMLACHQVIASDIEQIAEGPGDQAEQRSGTAATNNADPKASPHLWGSFPIAIVGAASEDAAWHVVFVAVVPAAWGVVRGC